MKIGKVGLGVMMVVLMMMLNLSTCSAWFGNKRKIGRNSILPGEAMSSRPSLMNHAAGSSIVFPIYGNVYPVGYDIFHFFLFCVIFCSSFLFYL